MHSILRALTGLLVGLASRQHGVQASSPSPTGSPVVQLNYSTYRGTSLSNNVDQFIGMRYAEAPLGELRWRAPNSPRKQSGIQSADHFGDYCIGTAEAVGTGASEDCLFVNVWRPSNATASTKLPVWIFIQGGGFNLNYSPNYNGSDVVEKSGHNIVLVNFNWRVSLYGFLAGRSVERDGNLNAGLLDQLLLFQWVHDNIEKFGGDPGHVVIHGSSAGAGSVALHLLNEGNKHLFAGAIMESTFMPTQPHKTELEWQYDRLVREVGCSDASDTTQLKCLRSKTTEELQKANIPSPFPVGGKVLAPVWYWTPCIDGKLIQDKPLRMFKEGKFLNIPMIIGNNENEGAYFAANASTQQDVAIFTKSNYPRLSKQEIHAVEKLYPQPEPVPLHAPWFPAAEKSYGESTFICPALGILDAAEQFNKKQNRSSRGIGLWSYHMNVYDKEYVSQGLGCPHGYEEGIIFGPAGTNTKLPNRYQPPASLSTYNAPLVPIIMDYWISFVRTLSPNTYRDSNAPEWQQWGSGSGRSKLLVRLGEMHMETVAEQQKERCDFWNRMDRSLFC